MAEPILKVSGLNKHFGGVVATDNLDFEVLPGETHAVIGPNGIGDRQTASFLHSPAV